MTPVRRAVEDVIKYRDSVGMDRIVISSSSISFWLGRSCNAFAVRRIEHCQAKQIPVLVKKIRKAIQENPLRISPDIRGVSAATQHGLHISAKESKGIQSVWIGVKTETLLERAAAFSLQLT
jgi:hypothetical protein